MYIDRSKCTKNVVWGGWGFAMPTSHILLSIKSLSSRESTMIDVRQLLLSLCPGLNSTEVRIHIYVLNAAAQPAQKEISSELVIFGFLLNFAQTVITSPDIHTVDLTYPDLLSLVSRYLLDTNISSRAIRKVYCSPHFEASDPTHIGGWRVSRGDLGTRIPSSCKSWGGGGSQSSGTKDGVPYLGSLVKLLW